MRHLSILRRIGGWMAATTLLALIAAPRVVAQVPDSEEISKLLTEARSYADQAAEDGATLQSYTRSTLAWQTHNAKLAEMAEHVNALGRVNKQLNDLRPEGSPWQQKAIGQIDSLLRDMADQLTATIKHLDDNKARVHMLAYQDYARATYERAERTAQMISDFVEYDKASAKAESLEQKLELDEKS